MEKVEMLKMAKTNLESKDIYSKIENDTLYVQIGDVLLELAEFEIHYQAKEFINNQNK
jgi:hypothetical protein